MQFETFSEKETVSAGEMLAKELRPGSVVALYGGLGAGKTQFVRGLARGLGLRARVSSPTFTIVNEYGHGQDGRRPRAPGGGPRPGRRVRRRVAGKR